MKDPERYNIIKIEYVINVVTNLHEITIVLMAIADSGLPELEGQLRLVDKISPSSGRLEILLNGLWGTVCSYHFDLRDAVVACKDLGYTRLAQLIRKLV